MHVSAIRVSHAAANKSERACVLRRIAVGQPLVPRRLQETYVVLIMNPQDLFIRKRGGLDDFTELCLLHGIDDVVGAGRALRAGHFLFAMKLRQAIVSLVRAPGAMQLLTTP